MLPKAKPRPEILSDSEETLLRFLNMHKASDDDDDDDEDDDYFRYDTK